jgi:hypothetical protein
MGAVKALESETPLDELVSYLNCKLVDDSMVQQFCHKQALEVAYGHYPQSIQYNQWQDEQELLNETVNMKLYWATYTLTLQKLLSRMSDRLYSEGK